MIALRTEKMANYVDAAIFCFFFINCICYTSGSYPCLCSYELITNVYSGADRGTAIIGYMYEFDCKPSVSAGTLTLVNNNFHAIQYGGQVGYVEKSIKLSEENCPGFPLPMDLVTTVYTTTTTMPTSSSTTVTMPTNSGTPTVKPTLSSTTVTMPTNSGTPTVKPTLSSGTVPATSTSAMTSMTVSQLTNSSKTTVKPTLTTVTTPTNSTTYTVKPTSKTPPATSTLAPPTSSTLQKSTTQPTFTKVTSTSSSTSSKPLLMSSTDMAVSKTPPLHHTHHHTHQHVVSTAITKPTSVSNQLWGKFGKSCYLLNLDGRSRLNAQRRCNSMQAHLVFIESQQEQTFLEQYISHHPDYIAWQTHSSHHAGIWTGGMKKTDWLWKTKENSSEITYTNWDTTRHYTEKPPSWQHTNRACIALLTARNFTWNDLPCSRDFFFICEKRCDTSTQVSGYLKTK